MATEIRYKYINDYNSKNRIVDLVENFNLVSGRVAQSPFKYNPLVSANSIIQYYKVGDTVKVVELGLPGFVGLSIGDTSLVPDTKIVNTVVSRETKIKINNGIVSISGGLVE